MTRARTVLLVDSNPVLRRALGEQLANTGYAVVQAADTEMAAALSADQGFDAVVLDESVAESADRLCSVLRKREPMLAVIVLGAPHAALCDEFGAEAIAKPYRLGALLGRLRTLIDQAQTEIRTIGPYRFQPAAKRLLDGANRCIRLTEKETAILDLLSRAGDKPVSRERLLHEVWGYHRDTATHTIETHVYRLRRKLGTYADPAPLLVTEPGGYRLAG